MNFTLHVWRQKNATDAGRMVQYQAKDVSPDMSFSGDARRRQPGAGREGRRADRVRPRLPRRHLRRCSLMINGRGARSRATRRRRPARSTCASSRTATTIYLEPWRARRFRSSRIWSSIAAPSTASFRRAASSRASTPAARRTATACRCRSRTRRRRWTRPRASAAGPAWPRARTRRRCCSSPRKCHTWRCCRRAEPERPRARAQHGGADGRGGFRRLHELFRVRGGVSEGDQRRLHRQDEPRVFESERGAQGKERDR